MEVTFVCVFLFVQIFAVFAQVVPADRTFEICTGSRLVLTFDEVPYDPDVIVSWLFTPPGSSETDIGAVRKSGEVITGGIFSGRTFARVGDLGMALSDMTTRDTGLYRVSQSPNFLYNVTVKDPCLNITAADPKPNKNCVDINCYTGNSFVRLEVDEEGSITRYTQVPQQYCGSSVVNVMCIANVNGQDRTDQKQTNLLVEHEGGLGDGEIAGIVVGGVVLIGGLGVLVSILFIRKRNSRGFHNP